VQATNLSSKRRRKSSKEDGDHTLWTSNLSSQRRRRTATTTTIIESVEFLFNDFVQQFFRFSLGGGEGGVKLLANLEQSVQQLCHNNPPPP
jgi:hypothetical protein